jgi:steroid 5-alpha reductase family enzyme
LAVAIVALAGEGVADRQLQAFSADAANKCKIMDRGLWAWSRHPNYFFEWLGWWAYVLIAVGPTGLWPWGWLALSAPAFMWWLLVHASGIPPLERHMVRSRGDAFRAYQRRVNAFFPGPPRD